MKINCVEMLCCANNGGLSIPFFFVHVIWNMKITAINYYCTSFKLRFFFVFRGHKYLYFPKTTEIKLNCVRGVRDDQGVDKSSYLLFIYYVHKTNIKIDC